MSSKTVSYYDWQLSFKKKSDTSIKPESESESNLNSLGIPEDEFKNFLAKWEKKNL